MGNEHTQSTLPHHGSKPQAITRLMEGLPPHALEAESSLLGSILIDPTVLNDVQLILHSADDFFKKANGLIFESMVELYNQCVAVLRKYLRILFAVFGIISPIERSHLLIDHLTGRVDQYRLLF